MTFITVVQDSVVVNMQDPMVLELGERAIESMFYENFQAPMIRKITVSGRAARANAICSICYASPSGSRRHPDMCVACAFGAHVEGYL